MKLKSLRIHLAAIVALGFVTLLCGSSAHAQLTTFSYTGGVQTYTVPAGKYFINLDLKGAAGGNNDGIPGFFTRGGSGGETKGVLSVIPGDVFYLYVGGQGGSTAAGPHSGPPAGYNGGGWGGQSSSAGHGAAGGGGTDIRMGGTAITNRVAVAGGGGGSGNADRVATFGGNGGGLIGEDGYYHGFHETVHIGGGGTQDSGGHSSAFTSNDSVGVLFYGGRGGWPGGGGGGGYYGGGGGGLGGGGGGSSYTHPTLVSSVLHIRGANYNAHGSIAINAYECMPPTAGYIIPQDTLCVGYAITLIDTAGDAGGIWRSSNTAVAIIDSITGRVAGVATGTAIITYTATNACGSDMATATVVIGSLPCIGLPTAIGNLQSGQPTIVISPNPSKGIFSVIYTGTLDEPVTIEIHNLLGEKISEQQINTITVQQITIKRTPGIYIITATNSKSRVMQRLVVE